MSFSLLVSNVLQFVHFYRESTLFADGKRQFQNSTHRADGMEDASRVSNSSKTSDEDLLREKEFSKPKNLNISTFMIQQQDSTPSKKKDTSTPQSNDIAVGGAAELFVTEPSISETKSGDVQAEATLSKGLIIVMICIWTAIGATVGTQLSPLPSAVSLVLMAMMGFYLSNRWIPTPSMRYLGVAWAIISMKLLYGLSIDAWSWGWFSSSPLGEGQTLGAVLLACVGLNIGLAFYHDEDAIATQATLVFFAIGSATGGLFGGTGVAIVLFIAMLCMHSLAFLRSSGNLASLGIAVSFLWIGIHALADGWNIVSLEVVQISNQATLFLLMCGTTGVNAYVATRFVREENWLSTFVETIGFGKPSLWAISVGLGMCGALMTIAAHREETSFALAQLFLLAFAFTMSYLVVRGVPWAKVAPVSIIILPLLALIFVFLDLGLLSYSMPYDIGPYGMFAAFAAMLTAVMLLQNQRRVSDHVLWIGALACSILLTLLISVEDTTTSRTLLVSQALLFGALSVLGFLRRSPSIAGAAILTPQLWLISFAGNVESRFMDQNIISNVIIFDEVALWMGLLLVQASMLCVPMGQSQLNIMRQLDNLSEFGSRLQQSNILQLWNISFLAFTVTLWTVTFEGGIPYLFGALLLWFFLSSLHLALSFLRGHETNPTRLLMASGILAVLCSWNYGRGEFFFFAWTLLHAFAYVQMKAIPEDFSETKERGFAKMINAYLGLSVMLMLSIVLENPERIVLPAGFGYHFGVDESLLLVLSMCGATTLFLLTIPTMRNMLLASIFMIALFIAYGQYSMESTNAYDTALTMVLFIGTAGYATISGETRRGLTAFGKRDERIQRMTEKQHRIRELLQNDDGDEADLLARIDAEQVRLFEQRQKRKKRSGEGQKDEIYTADIHYQPIVVLAFVAVLNLGTAWVSYTTAFALEALMFATGANAILFGLARYQAGRFQLRMPDILGIESTAFFAMCALVVTHVAGRMTTGTLVSDNHLHLGVLFVGLSIIAAMTLHRRSDLGLRIPNVIEGIVLFFFVDRCLAILLGGEVPLFTQMNPLSGDLVSQSIPMTIIELGLLSIVAIALWIDQERERRELMNHRTAIERGLFLLLLTTLSWGVASLIFVVSTVRRSLAKQEPQLIFLAALALSIAYASIRFWMSQSISSLPQTGEVMFSTGLLLLVCSGLVVKFKHSTWLTPLISSAHLLLYLAPLLLVSGSIFILGILALSATTWLAGILEMRKSMRIVGALNLLVAWLGFAIEAIYGNSTELLFVCLIASAIVLFAVTTLSQSKMTEMMAED